MWFYVSEHQFNGCNVAGGAVTPVGNVSEPETGPGCGDVTSRVTGPGCRDVTSRVTGKLGEILGWGDRHRSVTSNQ